MDKIINETQSVQSTNAPQLLRTSPRTLSNTIYSSQPQETIAPTSSTIFPIASDDTEENFVKNVSLKNKRKNFNPRCSGLNEDIISVTHEECKEASLSPTHGNTNYSPLEIQPMIASNSDDNKYTNHNISSDLLSIAEESSAENDKKHFSTGVTTSTMLKNWQNLFDLQEFYHQQQRNVIANSNISSGVDNVDEKGKSDRSNINQEHITAARPSTPFDRQLKNDFTYNAFNAVQELLHVYGLSISPGDIVDAFKMQQQQLKKVDNSSHVTSPTNQLQLQLFFTGECQQPPTPPRTPISSLQATSAAGTPIPSTSSNYDRKDDHGSLPHFCRVLDLQRQSASETNNLEKQAHEITNPYEKSLVNSKMKSTVTTSKSRILNDADYRRGRSKNFSSENIDSNDDFVVEDSMIVANEDYKEFDVNRKGFNLQSHLNSQFSDRFDDSSMANFYDTSHAYDNDSNISSTIDDDHASSEDITMGGESAIFGDNRRSAEGSTGGDDEGDSQQQTRDENTGRLSVKNTDSLLEKCSLNVFSPILQLAQIQTDDKQLNAEGMNYLTKFSSYHQCKTNACQVDNLREHYHCFDIPCLGKVFNKKEEVIRHLKWHKKRAESLNYGFLRFSSSDDCSLAFGTNCTHNRKQTHYHCFQPNCDKVYISTSDVQMHSNYHRKDSAIYQEGFQRYRATEECNAEYCMFAGQRTTHFHCRRDNCRYTFKNKADMEKHKSYHIKDLQLARDGFKKFLKTESCPYERCRFSRICNHIHCVRENCHYVLHSSGQLLSHKRKHERMDSEQAYRRFKIVQKAAAAAAVGIMASTSSPSASGSGTAPIGTSATLGCGSESKASTPSTSSSIAISPELYLPTDYSASLVTNKGLKLDPSSATHGSNPSSHSMMQPSPLEMSLFYGGSGLSLDIVQQLRQRHQQMLSAGVMGSLSVEDSATLPGTSTKPLSMPESPSLKGSLSSFHANSVSRTVMEEIEELIHQYFTTNCTRQASILLPLDQTEPLNLKSPASGTPAAANTEKIECHATFEPHLHCLFKNCDAIVPRALVDISDHLKRHELNRNAENIIQNSNLLQITSIEGFFNRKRGRPPKNRVVEVYNNARNQSPQAIFTSFKLEKTLNEQLAPLTSVTINQPRPANIASSTITSQAANPNQSYANTAALSLSSYIVTGRVEVFHSDAHKDSDTESNSCPMLHIFHFHCKFSTKCDFITKDALAMEQHISKEHIKQDGDSENEAIGYSRQMAKSWDQYDSSTECPSTMCIYRKKYSHFHCNKCEYTTALQHEIENHVSSLLCNDRQCNKTSVSQNGNAPVYFSEAYHNLLNNNNISDGSNIERELSADDGAGRNAKPMSESAESEQRREGAINYGTVKESINSPSPIKAEPASNDDEKVSVVRAAGTYFPQNSNSSNDIEIAHPIQQSDQAAQFESTNQPSTMCQRPFCKLKKKPHRHCNLCNQAFSDGVKLEIHRLKHSTLSLSEVLDVTEKDLPILKDNANTEDQPSAQEAVYRKAQLLSSNASPILNFSNATAAMAAAMTSSSGLQQLVPQGFPDNLSMQNLHLAHLALYQQNPFYYQSFYPFLRSQSLPTAFSAHPELLQVHLAVAAAASNGGPTSTEAIDHNQSPPKSSEGPSQALGYQFAPTNTAVTATVNSNTSGLIPKLTSNKGVNAQPFELAKLSHDLFQTIGRRKRKGEEFDGSPHELLDMGLGSASGLVTAGATKKMFKSNKQGNFKIFKDEPIPHGYLKFRFNEDCNFPNCGYRNHQSHFHCCRKDCYYSFCDKTRFVQHTARHERLDKLMGDDFKQYRANMRCGYEECVYNKNLAGQNNKSSHFHCLKCSFICSDTNKVVAHRRQHSKMEFIRMAGFRKVANNEKCTAHKITASSVATANILSDQITESSALTDSIGNTAAAGGECTYSLKQTHYHCLVCDCSVLSRAQLGSHRHRMQ